MKTCHICGDVYLCQSCAEDFHKIDVSSGEDVCLSVDADCYSIKPRKNKTSSPSPFVGEGSSLWDTIHTLKLTHINNL